MEDWEHVLPDPLGPRGLKGLSGTSPTVMAATLVQDFNLRGKRGAPGN